MSGMLLTQSSSLYVTYFHTKTHLSMFLWLSGYSIALPAQRLWVRFPVNTHTDNTNV